VHIKLSIIIVSWNTRELLADCLESVWQEIAPEQQESVETLVVDNASSDGSNSMVRERFPWVQLIENDQNVGFAGANNQAIQRSSGRYVLLLNPDTKLLSGSLTALLTFMDEHPEAGAAGSRLLNADGSLQTSCYPAPTLWREVWRLFHMDTVYPYGTYKMSRWSQEAPRDVDVIQGAALIIRREALQQVGTLDDSYFMYSEEVDLCYRIQRAGWRLYWVPLSRVIHYGGQSTQQVAATMFLHLYRGKLLFFKKHHGFGAEQSYKLILLAASLFRLLLTPAAFLLQPAARKQKLALAGNYCRLVWVLPQL